MFKFDFVDFRAATPETEKTITSRRNLGRATSMLFAKRLTRFRKHNPDVVLVAFNGFGGDVESTAGPFPFHSPVDLRWLEVFDSIYSGDPRPSDVPEMNFWRSMDIYSDHMVRRYEQSFSARSSALIPPASCWEIRARFITAATMPGRER